MGLDMYLFLEHYESEYTVPKEKVEEWKEHFWPEELKELKSNVDCYSKTTCYQVGYWRKANAIHKWFCDNCADGEDNCERMWVSPANLEKLIMICSEVLSDHSRAEELLPTTDGFFFGDTSYDEWYFRDLEKTVRTLEPIRKILAGPKGLNWDVYYRASW